MAHPQFTEYEQRTRHTFHAMMLAFSYPGRTFDLQVGGTQAYADIADSLLDLETSFYCEDEQLVPIFSHTGARHLSSDRAAYHFYPQLDESQLDSIKQASIGTLVYPDQSATIFIGCTFGQGTMLKLNGPGIPPKETPTVEVDGVPSAFWTLRESANRYPRGWDVYLVCDDKIIGLPRTTRVTVEE